jgi:transposase
VKERGSDSLVYMDETGFESSTTRTHGYGIRGKKVHGSRSGNTRPRTSLILAQQKGKWLAPVLFKGTANAALVNQWFEQQLLPELKPASTIILDNARFHDKKALEAIVQKHGHFLCFLPPYSPDFNKIEKTFANIKKYRQLQPTDTTIDTIIQSYGNYSN